MDYRTVKKGDDLDGPNNGGGGGDDYKRSTQHPPMVTALRKW